jgi:hypothetical protein
MPIGLAGLPPRMPAEVRRVRDQTRSILQDALRAECRLVLRAAEEVGEQRVGAPVPVEVSPGHPAVLDEGSAAGGSPRMTVPIRAAHARSRSTVPDHSN